jgi:Tfp pilus assembly protein PilN
VRAVNLIPQDLRKGAPAGRTGNAVYLLLGALVVAVVLVAAWTIAGARITDAQNELTRVQAEADAAEQRAGQLEPYTKFASMAEKRVETVSSLSRSRFNWPYAIREVSRTIPANVWLAQVVGTVAPGVTVDDVATGATQQLRNALAVPAIEVVGCSTGQSDVARYLARLRSVEGVTRVSLASSEKTTDRGGGGTDPDESEDCRQGNRQIPKFEAVVFFERSTASVSAPTAGAAPAAEKGESK